MTPEKNNDESYQDSAAYYFSKYHETKKEFDSLEAEMAAQKKEFDKNAKEIKELTKERAELLRQSKKDKEITRKLQEAIHLLEAESKQNEKQTKKVESLEKSIAEKDEEIKKQKTTIQSLERKLKEKTKEFEKVQKQALAVPPPPPKPEVIVTKVVDSKAQETIDELQREIEFLTEENKSKYEELMQNKRRIFNLERDNKQLRTNTDRGSRDFDNNTKDSNKDSVKESNRDFNRDFNRESNRESNKESIRESNRESFRESFRDSNRDSNRNSHKETRVQKKEESPAFNGRTSYKEPETTRNSKPAESRKREKETKSRDQPRVNGRFASTRPSSRRTLPVSYFQNEDSVNDLPETLSIPECETELMSGDVKEESYTTAADSQESDNELNEVIRGKKRKLSHKREEPTRYKDTDDEEDDDDDDEDGKRSDKKKAYYTADEDKELINIVFNGGLPAGVPNIYSNTFWKSTSDRMSSMTIVGRSWCGIKKRFVNHILRDIHNCNFLHTDEHRETAHNYYRHYFKLFGDDWCNKYDEERRKNPGRFSGKNFVKNE